MYSYFFANGPN